MSIFAFSMALAVVATTQHEVSSYGENSGSQHSGIYDHERWTIAFTGKPRFWRWLSHGTRPSEKHGTLSFTNHGTPRDFMYVRYANS